MNIVFYVIAIATTIVVVAYTSRQLIIFALYRAASKEAVLLSFALVIAMVILLVIGLIDVICGVI